MAQDKLSILIQALLDVSNSQEAVNKGVKELQKNAPKINIKADIDKESVLWDKTLGEDLKTLERKIKIFTNEQGQLVKETKFFAQEVNEAGESYTVLKKKTEEIISDYKKLRQELERQDKLEKNIAMTVANKIRDLQTQATILKTNYEQGDFSQLDEFTSQLEKQRFTSENYKNILNELSNEYKKLASSVKESHAANVTATKDQEKQITQYNKLSNELKKLQNNAQSTNTVLKNFGGKEHHIKADDLTNSLNKLNISQDMTQKEMEETIAKARQLSNSLNNVSKEAKATGNNSMTFGKMLSTAAEKFTVWIGVTTIFFATVRAIKSGIDSIIELDDALVELRKVTNLTSGDLKTFTNQASEVAERVARTTAEVTKATAMFARMGFTVQESLNLAEWANVLTNVGDGINSVEDASTSIISTLKGFGMEASNVQKIIDSLNEVSNNFALNTSDLSEGIRRVSATLSSAGNTFDETIGLLTAAIEVIQDAPRAATGIRTIALRLRGVTEEGEEIAELVPTLEKNFQKFGITLEKSNGQFKSTYEILQDLAKVRNKMSDFEFAEISELVSGKRQSDILNAILMNINSATAAMETSANSAGSALKEQEAYLDSITAKINRFKQVTQDMWQNTISSDIIKFFVDLGTESIKVTDKIGLLNVALVALAAFLSTKYPAVFTMLLTKMGLIVASADGMAVAFNGVTMSAKAMNAVLTLGIGAAIMGVIVGIKALAEAHDNYIKKLNENIEAIEKSIQQNEQELQSLNQLADEYNKLLSKTDKTIEEKKRIVELNKTLIKTYPELNTYVDTEGKLLYITADALKEVNEQRKETIRLQKGQILEDRIKIIKEEQRALKGLLGTIVTTGSPVAYDKYQKSLSNITDQFKLLQNNILEIEKSVDAVSSFSETVILKLSDAFLDEFIPSFITGEMTIDQFNNQWKKLIQNLNNNEINQILEKYDNALNSKNVEDIKNLYQQLDVAIRNSTGDLIGLVDLFGSLDDVLGNLNKTQQQYIPTAEELTKAYEKATDAIDDYQSSVKQLSDIYNTINEDGKVSADTLLDLIQKYPQLASQIANMNSSKEAGLTLAKTLFELEKKNAITELNNNKAILDSKLSILEADEKKYKLEREKAAQRGDGEGVIRATNALGMLDIKDLRNQSKAIDEAIKTITDLTIKDFEKSITKSTFSALSPIPYEDLTKELIRSYNAEVELSKIQEKLLNNQIKQAEKAKDYNKAIELQNKLLENQQKTVNNLQQANQKIHEEANRLRSTSKYDTTSWFDINGEMTLAYKELLNSFAGKTDEFSKKEKESIEDLFNKLSLLKKGWYENADAINTYNESIDQSKDKISEFVNSRIQDEIDSLEYVYGRGVISTQQYYDALIALREKYSKDIEKIDPKIRDALNDSIDEQNKVLYENELKALKHRNEDGIILKRQYYDQLVALAEKYGSFLREYDADSFRSLTKEIQFVFDDLKKDAEDYTKSYISYINSQLEVEIKAIEKAKDAYKEAQQEKINAIQKQIDALEKQNSLEKEAEERAKRLKDINKARGELAEIEADKSVRILTNEGWKSIADPKKLKSAREQLDKLNEDYQEWELEQTKKHEKEKLQEIINALKEEMSEKEKLYNKDIEKLRSALTENNKLVDDSTKEQIKSWDALIEKLQELGISYETELAKAIEAINNYNNAVLTMENKANIPDPKPSGIPSSSTINKSKEIQIVNELLQEAYKQQKTATGAQLKNIKEIIKELEEKLRKLRSAKVYDVGGILPTNSMAINTSGKPERILPPQLTVTFDKFVNKLPNLMKVLDSLKIPNFNFPYVGNKSNNGNGQVVNYYVNIDKVETPDAMSFINDLPRLALQYK